MLGVVKVEVYLERSSGAVEDAIVVLAGVVHVVQFLRLLAADFGPSQIDIVDAKSAEHDDVLVPGRQ